MELSRTQAELAHAQQCAVMVGQELAQLQQGAARQKEVLATVGARVAAGASHEEAATAAAEMSLRAGRSQEEAARSAGEAAGDVCVVQGQRLNEAGAAAGRAAREHGGSAASVAAVSALYRRVGPGLQAEGRPVGLGPPGGVAASAGTRSHLATMRIAGRAMMLMHRHARGGENKAVSVFSQLKRCYGDVQSSNTPEARQLRLMYRDPGLTPP